MQSALSDQADLCADRGNGFPFCYPTTTDVWKNGTTHDFIWNYDFPYYSADQLSLYLYYMVKFEYVNVKNYLNIDRLTGGLEVTVDDTWFLNKLEPGDSDQNLTILGFYLPSTANSTVELSSPISQFPRPFNFTVTQIAPPGNRTTNNTNSTNDSNNSSGSSSGNNNSNSNSISSSLPGWAIAVIVLAVVAIVCGAAALIWTIVISRRSKRNNKLIPIAGDSRNNHNNDNNEKRDYPTSINSQAKMTACRSTDSVPMTTASAAENASSIGSLASRRTFAQQQPLSPTYDTSINKLSSTEAVLLADTFRNTLGRSTADWNNSVTIGDEQEEELKRRRLGEALLQRQLEEDGTSVKHAGRFTRVKSLADIQKSAVFEQPKY